MATWNGRVFRTGTVPTTFLLLLIMPCAIAIPPRTTDAIEHQIPQPPHAGTEVPELYSSRRDKVIEAIDSGDFASAEKLYAPLLSGAPSKVTNPLSSVLLLIGSALAYERQHRSETAEALMKRAEVILQATQAASPSIITEARVSLGVIRDPSFKDPDLLRLENSAPQSVLDTLVPIYFEKRHSTWPRGKVDDSALALGRRCVWLAKKVGDKRQLAFQKYLAEDLCLHEELHEGVALYRDVIAGQIAGMNKSEYGSDAAFTARDLINVLYKHGRKAEAEQVARGLLSVPDPHGKLGNLTFILGSTFDALSNYALAEQLYKLNLERATSNRRIGWSRDAFSVMENYAKLLKKQRRFEEAASLEANAERIKRQQKSPEALEEQAVEWKKQINQCLDQYKKGELMIDLGTMRREQKHFTEAAVLTVDGAALQLSAPTDEQHGDTNKRRSTTAGWWELAGNDYRQAGTSDLARKTWLKALELVTTVNTSDAINKYTKLVYNLAAYEPSEDQQEDFFDKHASRFRLFPKSPNIHDYLDYLACEQEFFRKTPDRVERIFLKGIAKLKSSVGEHDGSVSKATQDLYIMYRTRGEVNKANNLIPSCPQCHQNSKVVPVVYGLLTGSSDELEAAYGPFVQGGCVDRGEGYWLCRRCDERF